MHSAWLKRQSTRIKVIPTLDAILLNLLFTVSLLTYSVHLLEFHAKNETNFNYLPFQSTKLHRLRNLIVSVSLKNKKGDAYHQIRKIVIILMFKDSTNYKSDTILDS